MSSVSITVEEAAKFTKFVEQGACYNVTKYKDWQRQERALTKEHRVKESKWKVPKETLIRLKRNDFFTKPVYTKRCPLTTTNHKPFEMTFVVCHLGWRETSFHQLKNFRCLQSLAFHA